MAVKVRPGSLWLALAALLAAGAAGCLTPSVPIPPPDPENMVFEIDGDAGEATFSYDPDPSYGGAIVYVFNREVGLGIITTAGPDGRVEPTPPFAGVEGDRLIISFELETQLSSRCIVLRPGRSSPANQCDL
jgi:hypothetical protein